MTPDELTGETTKRAAVQLAQPYGFGIRHEYDENASAVWMRILQIHWSRHCHLATRNDNLHARCDMPHPASRG
jgi:hypothetical protein